MTEQRDRWSTGSLYEPYVGRWSRLVAREFIAWLDAPPGLEWLDVGCGTGAITETILEQADPCSVRGIDLSAGMVEHARAHVTDPRARFEVAGAQAIPLDEAEVDVAISGLVLNFVPEPSRAASEMVRVTRPGGRVAAYVWDYLGRMELMRHFWDAARALDPAMAAYDEGSRFPLCQPGPLTELFEGAGLRELEVRSIDVPTHFRDFDDYWSPFLGGEAPAPRYAMSLSEERRAALRERLRAQLPTAPDGSISLIARAWAVRGHKPAI